MHQIIQIMSHLLFSFLLIEMIDDRKKQTWWWW